METFEILIKNLAITISAILEFTSIVCIVVGFVLAIILLLKSKQINTSPLHNRLRLKFGGWLALALEFLLASDILITISDPTYENLIQLAIIAVIRTFLNYFLGKELKEESELINKSL